ncbi:hypothetical protein WJX81_003620 [Elliptochloris bilobata]|uniref:Uncharacterized protein n=1 Tax=Elliptochloris bilobata TaxID=381761 RepID=A0AAW1S4N2_9CHLO
MDPDGQRKLASTALLALAVLGPVLIALSGRMQHGLPPLSGAALGTLTRNRGSVGSYGSIGSIGSFYSIGSVGSAFSIGSVGSAFSVGSIFGLGTALAVLSVMSFGGCLASGYVGLPYGLGQAIAATRRRREGHR